MAGDSATFDRGMRKAAFAPLRGLAFVVLVSSILVLGRMTVDLVWTGSDANKVAGLQWALVAELRSTAQLPEFLGSASERATRLARSGHAWLYVSTGLDRVLTSDPNSLSLPEIAMRRGMDTALAQPRWQAMMVGTQVLLVRLAALTTAIPTLALAYGIGLLDGLVARSVRRSSGGRESATRYHRAKYLHASLVSMLLMFYFWWPERVELSLIVLILAVAGGVLLGVQAKFYKKYL